MAGEWTKRNGYTFNAETDQSVDGRDLWSGRVSLLVHPIENLTANLVWEHFSEDDDRLRSGKQLCTKDQRAGLRRWARRAGNSPLSTIPATAAHLAQPGLHAGSALWADGL